MKFEAGAVRIEPLSASHDRDAFFCGNDVLDRYLRHQAGQDSRRGIASIFVAVADDQPSKVLGYFTLSAAAIAPQDLPPEFARRLPHQMVPAALIGRLAVNKSVARRGLGGVLLADAINRSMVAAQTVAMWAVAVDPIDEAARRFYAAFGFQALTGSKRMFLTFSRR